MDLSDRYIRNQSSISVEEQQRLTDCCVLVVGAGGLGGHVLEGLVRIGVGHLMICDPDVIEASNLNRQLLALEGALGRPKVEAARERAQAINSAVELRTWQAAFPTPELVDALSGCDVVIDCLDSLEARQTLEARCHRAGVPLVYGSIAGSYIYFGISTPRNPLVAGQIGARTSLDKQLGNPYPTVAIAAGLQLQLALSVLLGRPTPDRGFYVLDLSDLTLDFVELM
ncbi:MAG: ThiF family adenylyltransferase [Actinomycetia bacterium]|nr:ThiF family adenylyltransferase [Actinomycetes bacterium]